MKKQVLRSSFLAGIFTLFLCLAGIKNHTLDDISKPYLGEYECKEAVFDNKDYLKDFSFIRLELKKGDEYILSFKTDGGEKKEVRGKYRYDKKRRTICFSDEDGNGIKREFPFENGKMHVNLSIGGKTLQLYFEQK